MKNEDMDLEEKDVETTDTYEDIEAEETEEVEEIKREVSEDDEDLEEIEESQEEYVKREPQEMDIKKMLITLIAIFVVFLILALIFKGIVGMVRNSKPSTKEEEAQKEEKSEQSEVINTETYTYSDLEQRIDIAAQRYQNENYQGTLESSEIWILKYKDLKEKGFISSKLLDPNDGKECDGYVKFIKNEARISYEPYIKCENNYQTPGFDASYLQ